MAKKHVRYNDASGRFETVVAYFYEEFEVGGGGQTNFTVTEPFTSSTRVVVEENGLERREGASYDFTRNVALNRIEFNYTVPQYAWVRVRVYS